MPYRFITLNIAELFAAVFSVMLAAATSIVSGTLSAQTIWDQSQLRMFCLIGALGGAFLAVALFPPKEGAGSPVRRLAAKFLSSGIAGMLFTPIVIRWREWPLDVDVVLAVSGAVALVAVTVLHTAIPILLRRLNTWLNSEDRRP